MTKEKKFERVVEWGNPPFNDKKLLILLLLMLIPIANILIFFLFLEAILNNRKIYWRKMK